MDHLPSPPWLRRLHPTEIQTVQYCLRMLRVRCPRQEEVVHTHLGFTSVRVNPWSVRVIHCFASHAVIAPRPKWEMCELMCIELFLAHVCWQCSVFWSTCFLTLPTASVWHPDLAQRSVALQQLTLLSWDSGTTVLRPCVPSPNMATNTLLGVSPTLPHLGPSHMS